MAPAGRWDGDEGQLAALYLAACSAYPPDSKSAKTGAALVISYMHSCTGVRRAEQPGMGTGCMQLVGGTAFRVFGLK